MVAVFATTFHGAMLLVCETKTRFLTPCLSSFETLIIGGQAGLAMSYFLKQLSKEYIVLEAE